MPIASTQAYIQSLLDGLPMPGNAPDMVAFITPPDPNVEAGPPTAYIWPVDGNESRNPASGGAIPRNTGPNTPAGRKPLEHMIDIYVVFFSPDDDPDADAQFPGIIDAVMDALRTSANPVVVTDPYTGLETQLIDVGERLTYRITINALADQAFNRYDGLVTAPVLELLQA